MSVMHLTKQHADKDSQSRQPKKLKYYNAKNEYIPFEGEWETRWCILPESFDKIIFDIMQFLCLPEDIFIVGFMRSGVTWIQEAAWLLLHNLNIEHASNNDIFRRSAFLDYSGLFSDPLNSCKESEKLYNPRLLKSHLPPCLLPRMAWIKENKIIYIARNVRDVVVSCYHTLTGMDIWSGNIHQFVDDFINDQIWYGPYWEHVMQFWKMRREPFIFFVTYEEMKRDLSLVLQRLATFLGKSELNDNEIRALSDHLSFKKMRENQQRILSRRLATGLPPEENVFKHKFLRRGIVGSYHDELSKEDIEKLNIWTKKNLAPYHLTEEDIFGNVKNIY